MAKHTNVVEQNVVEQFPEAIPAPSVELKAEEHDTNETETSGGDTIKQRQTNLELDHLRLKELEVSVLYEELNTRSIAALKGRMQHFITVKEIEGRYNKLVEADRVANEKAKQLQEQFSKVLSTQHITQN